MIRNFFVLCVLLVFAACAAPPPPPLPLVPTFTPAPTVVPTPKPTIAMTKVSMEKDKTIILQKRDAIGRSLSFKKLDTWTSQGVDVVVIQVTTNVRSDRYGNEDALNDVIVVYCPGGRGSVSHEIYARFTIWIDNMTLISSNGIQQLEYESDVWKEQ